MPSLPGLAALTGTILVAQPGPPPGLAFKDLPAIRAWADKTSFGGASVDLFRSGQDQIVLVRRSFTSGIESCGLTVFVQDGDAWKEGLSLGSVRGAWLNATQAGASILIRNSRSGAEVLRFSIPAIRSLSRQGAGSNTRP